MTASLKRPREEMSRWRSGHKPSSQAALLTRLTPRARARAIDTPRYPRDTSRRRSEREPRVRYMLYFSAREEPLPFVWLAAGGVGCVRVLWKKR